MQSFLSTGQRTLLRQLLELRLHELDRRVAQRQQGGSRVEHARDMLQQDGDDAPQRNAEREVDLAQEDRETLELSAVTDALARVHDADFGRCVDCGTAIPFERLKLEPWGLRCVECESRREQHPQPARPRASL